jgi:plastocyanin
VRKLLPVLIVALVLVPMGVVGATTSGNEGQVRKVQIPEADRFLPFAVTVHVGDAVKWTNGDGDDHTVVSIDAFNTAGHKGTDQLLPANGGTFVLHFNRPGVFVYYCRFHAQLDIFNQPIAPGPEGGIQSQDGNFGTPMSGVITVVGGD